MPSLGSRSDGRAILVAAQAVLGFAALHLVFAVCPSFWLAADGVGRSLGWLVETITRQRLSIGATFAGVRGVVLKQMAPKLLVRCLRKDRERLDSERKAIMGNIESKTVGIYDQLRQQRRGIAVTTLSDNSCAACGTTLTLSQLQNARSTSQLFYCPTCSRILYATT